MEVQPAIDPGSSRRRQRVALQTSPYRAVAGNRRPDQRVQLRRKKRSVPCQFLTR
jgi:hypothetical protein